jgi:hypothetical protein
MDAAVDAAHSGFIGGVPEAIEFPRGVGRRGRGEAELIGAQLT